MRKSRMNWGILVFFIPAIILSFMLWRDYAGQMKNINESLSRVYQLFYIDRGNKVLSVMDSDSTGLKGVLYDAKSQVKLTEIPLESNIHNQIVSSYQNGRLAVVTYEDSRGLQINMIDAEGGAKELALGTLHFSGFLDSNVIPWRGRLLISGETMGSALYIAQVDQGKLTTLNLNQEGLFPSRPTNMRVDNGISKNETAVPMFQVDLKDQRTGFISGLIPLQGQAHVSVQRQGETRFDAEDRAALEFAKKSGRSAASLIRVDSEYPQQAKFYNAMSDKWGKIVPTPQPVYQAQLYLLNDNEVLIAGSSAKDEADGKVLGYVYNERSKQFTDVTAIVGLVPYDELDGNNLHFYKQAGDDLLYYSGRETSAGWMNMKEGNIGTLSSEAVKQWQLEAGEDRISLKSFARYIKQGGALVVNWALWIVIPVFMFFLIPLLSVILTAIHRNKLENGVMVQGTIVSMSETGTYINEQPVVRFLIRFQDEGQVREVTIKKVISFLDPIRTGDSVVISYNRRKNKAVFVESSDVPEVSATDQIIEAVLTKIDAYGSVNRGQALLLHFEAGSQHYDVPVVQPAGFAYRIGERAELIIMGGVTRLFRYGRTDTPKVEEEQLTLQGEVTGIRPMDIVINQRRLTIVEMMVAYEQFRLRKTSSQFVPAGTSLQTGMKLPVVAKKSDLSKEQRLLAGKQGSGKVTNVEYIGTTGERPIARITIERDHVSYTVEQSIEPVYGVLVGDELWVAYDDSTREAVILNYSDL